MTPSGNAVLDVRLRPVDHEADHELLVDIYASSRAEELASVAWSDAERDAFIRMQFAAQSSWYREQYTSTTYSVIEHAGEPAGRLYVARWEAEVRIVDIALLPRFRGRGIGTALIESLQGEARDRGVPLRISVESMNRARALYARLGFVETAQNGIYLTMEWQP